MHRGRSTELPGDTAVIGALETVSITFSYANAGEEPALGSVLTFTVPERYEFERIEAPDDIAAVSCLFLQHLISYLLIV